MNIDINNSNMEYIEHMKLVHEKNGGELFTSILDCTLLLHGTWEGKS